jgi:MFS family permease
VTGRAAARRYTLVTFLTWLPTGLYLAPMVLLMLYRGLDLTTVAAVGAVYSITVATLELPTGGLADVIGRRAVLVASAVFSIAGLLALGLATALWGFAASAVLRAVARALSSGPAQAWYVDTVHAADGTDVDLTPGIARGEAASGIALAAGTLAGGLIPLATGAVGGLPALAVPVLIAAAVEIARLTVTAFGLPEPPHPRPSLRTVLAGVPATIATGVRLGVRDAVLIRLLGAAGAAGCVLGSIELLTPGWLGELTGDPERAGTAYAAVAAAGFVASAGGNMLSPAIKRRLGPPVRTAAVGLVIGVAALLGVAVTAPLVPGGTPAIVVIAAAYLLLFVGLGVTAAPEAEVLHQRVTAGERATVISVESLVLQLAAAAGAIVFARVADATSTALAFGGAGLVLLGGALLIVRADTSRTPAYATASSGSGEA